MAYKDLAKRKATRAKYYQEHKATLDEKAKAYRLAHPEMAAKACRKWREQHPDRAKAAVEKYWAMRLGKTA